MLSVTDMSKKGCEGAVTAEFAVILPAVVFMLALLLGAAATGICQLQLEEAARVAARAAARGEAQATIRGLTGQIDPDIRVSVLEQSGCCLQIQTQRQAPGLIGAMTGWQLSAQASVPLESLE